MKVPLLTTYRNYRKIFGPWSALKFPLVKLLGLSSPQAFHLRSVLPSLFYLRTNSSDFATLREVFVKQEYAWATAQLPTAPVIVDVGANVGLTSRYFLQHRPQARILAIEAMPDTYEVAQRNLGLPEIAGQCHVVNAAVWSTNDQITIGVPSPGAFSRATVGEMGDIVVRAYRLDSLLEEEKIAEVDLLKMDVEGAEVEIFRNADDWLSRIRALAIEFHGNSRSECHFDDAMARHGFQVLQSNGHTVYASRN